MRRPFALIASSVFAGLLVGLLVGLSPAQERPPANEIAPPTDEVDPLPVPDTAPEGIRTLVEELAHEGVRVDFAAREVLVKGVVLLDRMNAGYPIEYLIVSDGGFTHESLGLVRCTGSKLNAAFLALGLSPGKTVEYVKKDPLPPVEKIISGEEREFVVHPPEGAVVDLSVRWTDEAGAVVQRPIEDLVRYVTNGEPLPRRGFVFVGSRFQRVLIGTERQERFMADVEGNLVSLYLSGFGNCLFDMNSAEGTEAYLYDINVATCPPRGTKVTFVFAVR